MTDHNEELTESDLEEGVEEGVLLLERIRTDKPLIDLIIASQAFQLDHDLPEDGGEPGDLELVEKLMDEIMDAGQALEGLPEGVEITQEMTLSTRIEELEKRGLAIFGLLDEQDHILEEDENALPVTLKVAVIGVYPADDEHIVHFEGKELMPIMVDDWEGEEDYDDDCAEHSHGCGCGCGDCEDE